MRRVDFYDNRSRCVIEHRLKILTLLNRFGPTNPANSPADHLSSSKPFVETAQLALPKPLRIMSPTKARLRSSVQLEGHTQPFSPSPSKTQSNDLISHIDRLRNVALLLTMPHTVNSFQRTFCCPVAILRWFAAYFLWVSPRWLSKVGRFHQRVTTRLIGSC